MMKSNNKGEHTMPSFTTENLRAIALVGHSGAGKTSLAEALLFKSGAIGAAGSVEKGSTVCDFDPIEKSYKHSLNSSVVHFDHGAGPAVRIHLIDTPGYPDFMGPAISALDAIDTVVIVINAQNGIELTARRMMSLVRKRHLCAMVVVNKIDDANSDLPALLADIQEAFGRECLPINLPAGKGSSVTDCFSTRPATPIFPASPPRTARSSTRWWKSTKN
jgi:elongation factor G